MAIQGGIVPSYRPGFVRSGGVSGVHPPAQSAASHVAPSDVRAIQRVLDERIYSRDLNTLLDPATGFRVTPHPDRVDLQNLTTPSHDTRYGLCGEQATTVGNALRQDPALSQYEFRFATGFSSLFDTRTPAQVPKDKPSQGDHAYLVFWPKSNPSERWIIDPSYGLIKRADELPGYTIGKNKDGSDTIRNLDDVSPPPRNFTQSFAVPPNQSSEPILMGLAKNLLPPHKARLYPPDARVYMSFNRNAAGKIQSNLSLLERPDSTRYNTLPRFWSPSERSPVDNSALTRFMTRLDQDLQQPAKP